MKHKDELREILVVEITQEEYKNYINQKQVLEDIKNYCKDVKFDFGSKPVAIDILKIIEKFAKEK